VTSQAD